MVWGNQASGCARRFIQVLLLCGLVLVPAVASADKLKLYDGPTLPASQLVTLLVRGDSWPVTLSISLNGKKNVRVHNGAQVLPGTYQVNVLSLCSIPQRYPPANPPSGSMIEPFSVYGDSFTASAGETVEFAIHGVDYPVMSMGKKGHEYPLLPGSTCYGAWGVSHTVLRDGVELPDDENNGPFGVPSMASVMKYLEAEGRADPHSAATFLTQDCAGDLSGIFQKDKNSGWAFSASNTKFWQVPYKTMVNLPHHKYLVVPQDAGHDQIVAEVDFRKTEWDFHAYLIVFSLVQQEGSWKISRITDWWNRDTPVK